jgi:hypothetical protein
MTRRTILGGLLAVVMTGVLAACGGSSGSSGNPVDAQAADVSEAGDIPDSQVFVRWQPADARYSVQVPEGWARTDAATGASFTDKFNTVRIQQTSSATAPTVASVKADEVPVLASANPAFALTDVTAITRKGGPAILVAYTTTSAPDATTGKVVTLAVERYEFSRDGQVVALTLSGAKGADNVDPWRIVSDSFSWKG